ncbi:ABC transporter ATP-binding protein [Gemmobacter sp. 24YEA27]|uniref:energy-coupling factor ABC transporter ATP-binding protein n=1 Tax=Gemmobacter sp. 24YEA27 TaxID=3040672 RepID=UPI0024B35F5D|nr:ABC transporter ATP-binding protein [Gemmobacter sp. 24YEA27]
MALNVSDLSFSWPGKPPLFSGLSFTLAPGERLSILAGNGMGKTTLARGLAGFLTTEGGLDWQGEALRSMSRADHARLVQVVGQRPHLQLSGRGYSLREEVAFGPENLGLPVAEIRARTAEALHFLNLTHLAERDCRRLSGGETQRAALAGALAMRPRLLILDEPMTDLDAESRDALAGHLRSLPWEMAVIFLDIGWQSWMAGLVDHHLLLDQGEMRGPLTTEALFATPLPERIFLAGQPA